MNTLNEQVLKDIIAQTLFEERSKDDIFRANIPTFQHTARAFAVGDKVYLNSSSKGMKGIICRTIKAISDDGDSLILDGITKNIPTSSPIIETTDTWMSVFDMLETQGETRPNVRNVKFDYEQMNGERWVTVISKGVKYGIRYSDARSGNGKLEVLQSKTKKYFINKTTGSIIISSGQPSDEYEDFEEEYVYRTPNGKLWVKPEYFDKAIESHPYLNNIWKVTYGEFEPSRYGASIVKPEWLDINENNEFSAWKWKYRDEICQAFPWMLGKTMKWCAGGQYKKGAYVPKN